MANTGKDTNRAQFFLLFQPQPHLDGKHVVFGRMAAEGLDALKKGLAALKRIERVGSTSGKTSEDVRIAECKATPI